MGLKRTARFYKKNSAARKKKNQYQKAYNERPEEKKRRAELGRIRYAKKKKDGADSIKNKDYDHTTKKFEDSSKNRGRKQKSRLKGSKRKKK